MSARILVVDDILANRRLLQAKLEARYYQVIMADNGPTALKLAAQESPDIILMDVMMPGMDGYETTERLKADPATAHIPVVMVTALSQHEHRLKGLQVGADDFITKPFDDFALLARINALSRYNAVAKELRQREAGSGMPSGILDSEIAEMDAPPRVVIVDENIKTAKRLTEYLRSADHQAVGLHEGGHPQSDGTDVMVLSLARQSFDPLRVCAQFKMQDRTRAIAIIVVCDEATREQAMRALDLGASDIIEAPVDRQELIARVSTQARRTRYIDILRRRVDRGLELSVIDPLTGLYNRRYMMDQLSQFLQRTAHGDGPVSVIGLDIDHFKAVNDTYGHEAGDLVLKEFARRLKQSVRPKDVVCRPGGEEFLVVMPETPAELAIKVAERVRVCVAGEPFSVADAGDPGISVTVSAGVATDMDGLGTPDEVLRRADEALYRAKNTGRNRVESLAA